MTHIRLFLFAAIAATFTACEQHPLPQNVEARKKDAAEAPAQPAHGGAAAKPAGEAKH